MKNIPTMAKNVTYGLPANFNLLANFLDGINNKLLQSKFQTAVTTLKKIQHKLNFQKDPDFS